MYDTFLRIFLGGPISLLTISGNPTEAELYMAWQQIIQDYTDLINTKKSKNIFDLWLKICSTQKKLYFLDSAFEWLRMGYDKDIAEKISEMGYELIEPNQNRIAYLRQIELVQSETKVLVVLFNQYANEYNILCPQDNRAEVKRSRMDYEKELTVISKFMGFRIEAESITVFKFVSYINTFIELNTKDGTATTI